MAMREGFEPSIRLQTVYSLSRGAPSASRPPHHMFTFQKKYGASWRIRTSDRLVRSQVLYPAELRTRCRLLYKFLYILKHHNMAMREGFEPSIRLQTVYSLSRGAPSASRPPHRLAEAHITIYPKYVKHFLGKKNKNHINRWQFNQSVENLRFRKTLGKNKHLNNIIHELRNRSQKHTTLITIPVRQKPERLTLVSLSQFNN